MEKLSLGNSGLKVSALAFGTDLFGSKIDEATCFSLLDSFAEQGGTLLDTGNFYASWLPGFQGGESESVLGRWMKSRQNRTELVLATKLGFDYPGSAGGLSETEIERECDKSLRRLQTETLDLYYAHRDDRATPLEETMQAFDRLIKKGKVRAIGASNLALWRIAEANAISRMNGWTGYSVVEQRYTYLQPRPRADFGPQIFISDDLKDFATAHSIALIGYSILLRGAYTRSDREMPAQFAGAENTSRLNALRLVAQQLGCSPNQVVIAWMRHSKPSILPIVAASRIEQLTENIDALNLSLSEEQLKLLENAGAPADGQGWIQPT